MVRPDKPYVTVLRMRFACWIAKVTDTHSEYVALIAFPKLQWLSETRLNVKCTLPVLLKHILYFIYTHYIT